MKNNITLAITLTITFIAALYLGNIVASGDIVELSGWFGATLLILFLIKGYQFSWQVVLFIAWGNISFLHSFRIEPLHATSVVFVLFTLSSLMRNVKLPAPISLRGAGVVGLNVAIVVFLLYGASHIVLSRVIPHVQGEFSWGNSAKGYFKAFFALVILLLGLNSQIGFQVRRGWTKTFLIVLSMAVIGNLAYLVFLYLNGFSAATNSVGFDEIGVLHIPLINALPHHFAMRTLGPIAALFGFGFLTLPGWWREQSWFIKAVTLIAIFGGLSGALMSGGRAAVAMCLMFLGAVALYRKKVILIGLAIMSGALIVVSANLFSGLINEKAPVFVARPLQYFMIDKGRSMETINNSQDQRDALFQAALDEWRSDPRITLIGRGIYRYSNSFDDLRSVLGEKGAFVEVNLRAGTCHALIPSALIQYGIVGFFLYMIIWILLLRFNWKLCKLLKREGYSQELQTVTACLLIYNILRILIDLVAAGWMTIFTVTLFILIRSRMSYELARHFEEERASQTREAEGPRQSVRVSSPHRQPAPALR